MLTSATKRVILPFSETKSEAEVESAAVFALVEAERNKGGSFLARQPKENLIFLSKVGYPVWLFSKNNRVFLFDALGNSNFSVSYLEVPLASSFLNALETNSRPRENYTTFLIDNANYFQRNINEKRLILNGLIGNPEFKKEFSIYRKEASEPGAANMALLLPSLDESTISALLMELDKLQLFLKEDTQRLPECLRLISRTTSQYITELDYEAAAASEEADAKIKAQEEIVNPKIAQLNKEYNRKIKDFAEGFKEELESLEKLKAKTKKFIERNQEEIRVYGREAKAHSAKGHQVYEKRWKEKIKKARKEQDALKKELKNIEANSKKLTDQKTQAIANLNFELDREIKLARQPLVELEAAREIKTRSFKQEVQRLLLLEKPVIEGINKTIKLREAVDANFEALNNFEPSMKTTTLFYMPFYVACYEAGISRRYRFIAPSTVNRIDFSTKLRGAMGISKIKELLMPRFKIVTTLIETVEINAKQNPVFENRLYELSLRANMLKTNSFQENAKRGLVYLEHEGWLSERELQDLCSRLAT